MRKPLPFPDYLHVLGCKAHDTAREHGFYDPPPSVPERLCLIHSEISEALEAFRDDDMHLHTENKGKPEGFDVELADALIRIVDLCVYLKLDLDRAVEVKMAYNRSRPFKHGRKVL